MVPAVPAGITAHKVTLSEINSAFTADVHLYHTQHSGPLWFFKGAKPKRNKFIRLETVSVYIYMFKDEDNSFLRRIINLPFLGLIPKIMLDVNHLLYPPYASLP